MSPVETYLRDLTTIRLSGAGVAETSYYPALSDLLNEVGSSLKPKVRCIIHLKSQGAGIPDGGLFTADQLRAGTGDPLVRQLPARAAIEAKPTTDNVDAVAASEQVSRYLDRYGLVLVTNFRDFLMVGRGRDGRPEQLESYRLAENEAAFWSAAAAPRALMDRHGDALVEYLKRAMLANAPLRKPEDVAWFLASYARDALARVERADVPALSEVRMALEEALGLTFQGEKGTHFFRSTLVQTLFYGVFSAWVLWHEEDPAREDRFDWRTAAFHLNLPVIEVLFEKVGDPSKLRALNLLDVLGWAGETLNRVDREAFFSAFEAGQAVQYFYEPFLKAFDPELRKELGVWYTPPEIVKYMVTRVDTVLREDLDIPDGLADPRVVVLDPCAGTGAYLVEVLKRIAATLETRGEGALLGNVLMRAASERVVGFEILPAPYVVAHMQLGLLLRQFHSPVNSRHRPAMYLTNALTGWERGILRERRPLPGFPELEAERDAAQLVKRDSPILVVLGNPPYNAFAGVSPVEEKGLVEPYKEGLISEWGIKKFNLDDLYVRFFRLAERQIAEHTGRGVVCFISNYSYLSDPSFVVLRRRFLTEFDELWFDCLNGDSRETGKLTPEGKPDPSVFSTDSNPAGIRVGTAVGLMVRREARSPEPVVRFRQFWGVKKREALVTSLSSGEVDSHYELASPTAANRHTFRPNVIRPHYMLWPTIRQLAAHEPLNGPIERRGNALIAMRGDEHQLENIAVYLDPSASDAEVKAMSPALMNSSGEFDAVKTRTKLKASVRFDPRHIVRYPFKPFDVRQAYLDPDIQPLFSRPSPELLALQSRDNRFLVVRETSTVKPESPPMLFSSLVCDYHCLAVEAKHIPFQLRGSSQSPNREQARLLPAQPEQVANLSPPTRTYLASLSLPNPDTDPDTAALIWMHALAIGFSPAYLADNADGVRQDWPRIPLPSERDVLLASAAFGRRIAALLDTESPVNGVTTGSIQPELRAIGVVAQTRPGPVNLSVTAGWGHGGQAGVTMPGKGRWVERQASADEREVGLNKTTVDVYLNDDTYWRNVPQRVWEYTIGGYQVMKKWLSYREQKLLGRPLSDDEAREVRDMARRIAAIVMIEPELNANYAAIKNITYLWPENAVDGEIGP